MLTKISTRLELFFLNLFIYVLSNTKWFRILVRGFYELNQNRRLFRRFISLCLMFGLLGIGLGWALSIFLDRAGIPGIF